MIKKIFLSVCTVLVFAFSPLTCFGAEEVDLFVATDGSDVSDGSINRPFRTLQRAREQIRALKKAATAASPLGAITVNIRGGEYAIEEPLRLSGPNDSGTAGAPVTWQAYNGERVLLSGGVKIAPSQVTRVTDPAILNRVLDKQARANLMSLNLAGYLAEIPPPGKGGEIQDGMPELYVNGKPLTRSRWPNDERNEAYLRMADMQLPNDKAAPFRFAVDGHTRMASWAAGATDDLYLYGFFTWDWADAILKVAKIDAEKGFVTTAEGYANGPADGGRFFFLNLIEEIDVPGEYYIDRANRVAFFYPPCDMTDAEIYLSRLEETMISLWECEYVSFRGLELAYTRGRALYAGRVSHIVVDGCTFAHASGAAVVIDGAATDCAVRNCHIYDTVGGVVLWNGELRATLTPSGNVIENNRLHDINRTHKCFYLPPIHCQSVGVVVRNNKIYDAPHTAIDLYDSNDGLVEYNEIHDVGQDAADMGAIYYGRNPSIMGIRIQYNYFYDIGNVYGGYGQQAIFCDDGASMPYIYGNIFYNACNKAPYGYPVKAHGSQFGLVKNNLFIDVPRAAYFQPWCADWDKMPQKQDRWLLFAYDLEDTYGGDDTWRKLTQDIDFFGDMWKEHYRGTQWEPVWQYLTPEGRANAQQARDTGGGEALLAYAYDNAPAQTNLFEGNVGVGVEDLSDGQMYSGNGTGNQNCLLSSGNSLFVDYGRDFTLTAEGLAMIRRTLPDFENIPAGAIGLKAYTHPDGKSRLPGGSEPSASAAAIVGNPKVGESLTATWRYADPEGVLEGVSVVTWLIGESRSGVFSKIPPGHHVRLLLDPEWAGKYIRFEVVPWNRNMLRGKAIQSAAVQIAGRPDDDNTPPDDGETPLPDDDRKGANSGGCNAAGGLFVALAAVLPLFGGIRRGC